MNSIQQTRFVAKNYPQLQGLRAVPLGLCLLLITLWANLQRGPASDLTLPILLSLACLVLYILVDQYYKRVYGTVKRTVYHAELLFQVASGLLALGAFIADSRNVSNISLLGLVFAAVFVFSGFWYMRPAKILFVTNLAIAAILALLSILPLFGFQNWWNLLGLRNFILGFTFVYGLFCVIFGIVLHIYFIRSLPAFQEAS